MRIFVLLIVVANVAGCGADGPPVRPTVSTGVSVGTNGVSAGSSVEVSSGAFSFGIGQSYFGL